MCVVLDVPPSIEAQVLAYETATGQSVKQMFIDYLQQKIAPISTAQDRVNHFRDLLSRQTKLEGSPYTFKRQDAYEEELA